MTELKEIAGLLREIRDAVSCDSRAMRTALETIGTKCERYTTGDCWGAGRKPGAEYDADAVCPPCLAARALKPEPSQPEPPSWADIPVGRNFRTQDANGDWWAFTLDPRPVHEAFWASRNHEDGFRICDGQPNPNWRETKQRRPEAIEPDWSKAPEWAEWSFVSDTCRRIWCEFEPEFYADEDDSWSAAGGQAMVGGFELLHCRWTQTLRQRPKPEAKPELDWTPPLWSECPDRSEWLVLTQTGYWLASPYKPRLEDSPGRSWWIIDSCDAVRTVGRIPPRHIWQSSRRRRPEGV